MHIRPAAVGDEGVLVGLEGYGSIAALILQVGENEQAFLRGDWRMVAALVDAFEGEHVAMVEGEGSSYGAHDLRHLECL